ncbi:MULTISPECIES: hypothetical protein [Arcobacteraceae]|uniref:Uncharacterized protein n=1 Tax=Aliarcobacter thereius TaxID=544718 RepID=A0A1C0B5D3_9BACT|nr:MULTISPECIES: hypothetical protein [Arcobacteraceae]MDX4013173.1 hypothetical protein [Aliarcobacter skirrowii]MDX4071624.1 hypothetical protein [Aliarcobacter skirrowii]OCL81655.1 hypothetical protein AAW29_01821 [Arcobacter porcinus]OCL86140.1 hypothetical protein AAX30_01478 [Arcobacter porcinus]OCL97708.1 hypothetical protein AAX29_01862 [Aliarcobacter thereius]
MGRLKIKSNRALVSTLEIGLNKKLIDTYRVKLFSKIKASFETEKEFLLKEDIEIKEWLKNIFKPINNIYFENNIRA